MPLSAGMEASFTSRVVISRLMLLGLAGEESVLLKSIPSDGMSTVQPDVLASCALSQCSLIQKSTLASFIISARSLLLMETSASVRLIITFAPLRRRSPASLLAIIKFMVCSPMPLFTPTEPEDCLTFERGEPGAMGSSSSSAIS